MSYKRREFTSKERSIIKAVALGALENYRGAKVLGISEGYMSKLVKQFKSKLKSKIKRERERNKEGLK